MDNSNEAIEDLIEKYSDSIRSVCRKYYLYGGNEDDLFQEGMIGFMQAVKNYDETKGTIDSDAFKKFALMCAKRQIIDAIKHASALKHQPLNNSYSLNDFALYPTEVNINEEDPESIYLENESAKEKMTAIKKDLSEFEGQVLSLFLEGRTNQKIAENFNKDVKSIENTIHRIKQKVKKEDK